ncbi:hypothetical protein ACTA71_007148 [Dictyostelium dimigraforme]
MKLSNSILILFVFLNISIVKAEYKSFQIQMDGCNDIMETDIGQCTLNKCNVSTSFKIIHVIGNLYEIFLYENKCEIGINYSFINCSTVPLSNLNDNEASSPKNGLEVELNDGQITLSNSTKNIYCFNEMSHSSHDDDLLQLNNSDHDEQNQSSISNNFSKYNYLTIFSYLLVLLII